MLDDPRNAEVMRRLYRWTRELRLIPTVAERGAMPAEGTRAGDAMFYLFAHGRFAMLGLPRWAFIMLRVQGELPLRVVEPFHGGFPNMEFGSGILSVYAGTKHPRRR